MRDSRNNTDSPNVNRLAMPRLLEDLWRHVSGGLGSVPSLRQTHSASCREDREVLLVKNLGELDVSIITKPLVHWSLHKD